MTDTFKIQKLQPEKWDVIRLTNGREIGRTSFYFLKSAFRFVNACNLPDVEEAVCKTCGGTGMVATMGYVYAGEPHIADVGEARCPDCFSSEGWNDRTEEQ